MSNKVLQICLLACLRSVIIQGHLAVPCGGEELTSIGLLCLYAACSELPSQWQFMGRWHQHMCVTLSTK